MPWAKRIEINPRERMEVNAQSSPKTNTYTTASAGVYYYSQSGQFGLYPVFIANIRLLLLGYECCEFFHSI